MATIRRAGFGTVFELEDSKVGIGTDAATHTLQALGNIRSEAATDIGISSLTTYQGFTDKEARFTTGQIDNQSQSGSTSDEIVIDGDVTVSSATTFTSGPQHLTVTDTFTLPSGDTNSRELKPTPGSLRFNQDFATLEFYTGNNWATVNTFTEMQNSPGNRGRGVFGGGLTPSTTLTIDFINIHSQGNASTFGELTGTNRGWICAVSNGTRGVWNSGSDYGGGSPNLSAIIDYVTIASEGDATDFGDPTFNSFAKTAFSSTTRGVWGGGWDGSSSNVNTIEYIEIATLGNALDFGDLQQTTRGMGSSGNQIRGIFAGGQAANDNSNFSSDIDFVTIASKGNATSFGNLTSRKRMDGGGQVSNSTKGLFWNTGGNTTAGHGVDSITIASEGNAVFFADGLTNESVPTCTSNKTRGVFAGGYNPAPTSVNVIDFVQFSTSGQVFDFGDLTEARIAAGGCSDSHGGLGGF